MPIYAYTAKNLEGQTTTGRLEAGSKQELIVLLRQKGLVLLATQRGKSQQKPMRDKLTAASDKIAELILRRVSLVEKMMFTRHLAVMITSGLALNEALKALAEQSRNQAFRRIIHEIDAGVTRGESFSDSLAQYPKVFNNLYVNMVKVGETGGNLTEVLRILAEQMKKDHELISRVKGAMMYPAVIIVAMIGIGILMMIKVVPQLTGVFTELNVELPASTKAVIAVSNFMKDNFLIGLAGLLLLAVGLRFLFKVRYVRKELNRISLYIPIFGSLIRKINSARFARTLSSLIKSGVAIVKALQIVSDTLGNIRFKEALRHTAQQVQKGENLSVVLAKQPGLFTPMVVQMVKVGEETGNLIDVLKNMAEFYEEEIDNITRNMSSIVEPIILIIVGIVVGFFAVSMLQPMYSMMSGL